MTVQFYCRTSKTDKKGYAPVEASLIVNGERTILSLQRKEKPADFSKAMSSKRGNDTRRYCDAMRVNINRAVTDIAESGEPLTVSLLCTSAPHLHGHILDFSFS